VSLIGSGAVCWSLFDILRCATLLNGIRPSQADRVRTEEQTANRELERPLAKKEIGLDTGTKVRYV
jgi:hypothetical protein